eukprot:3762295-Prorocentrum_lima.AAC.1
MTSSLVGSEMCIRDSKMPSPFVVPLPPFGVGGDGPDVLDHRDGRVHCARDTHGPAHRHSRIVRRACGWSETREHRRTQRARC